MIQERKYNKRSYRIGDVDIEATVEEERVMDKLSQPDYLKGFKLYTQIDCPGDNCPGDSWY